MPQNSTRPCSQCGTPLPLNQLFCSNCGGRQDINASTIPATPGSDVPPGQNMPRAGQPSNPSLYQQGPQYPPYGRPLQGYQQPSPPYGEPLQGYQQPPYQQVPSYAQPLPNSGNNSVGVIGAILGLLMLRRARRGARGRFVGCFVWLVIILAIIVCSIAARSEYATTHIVSSISNASNTQNDVTPTPVVQKATSSINAAIIYSGINLTIVDAQQASSFADDTDSNSPGLLRLDLKEQTGPISGVSISYTESFQLVSPAGTTINAYAAQHDTAPDQAVSRTNWVDFPIAKDVQVNQYTLRIGTATEAQMNVPLTGKTDLSKYQPQKVSPNAQFTYGGVNFILNDATAELSVNGPQAAKGMMYVTLNMTTNNNSSHEFYGSLTDTRLKSGTTTSPPLNPLNNAVVGQTNVQGTLTFIMPQGGTNFTLVFLPSTDNAAPTQVTTDFQIP